MKLELQRKARKKLLLKKKPVPQQKGRGNKYA